MQPPHSSQPTVSPSSIATSPSLSSSSTSFSSDFRNFEPHSDSGCEEEDDDERLASLEALRYALHNAPFSCNLHTLLPVPELLDWHIGARNKIAIRLEEVCYGNQLDSLSMAVPKGVIYIVLGAGHSGKSSLLRCILGTVKYTSGRIDVFMSGKRKRDERLSAICVGYMPQNAALHQELTVIETLQHYGRLYQLPVYVIRDRAEHLMRLVCLDESKHTLVSDLNANRKWRLSLAVALIHSPPLLLLDEPTHNLDPLIRRSIWNRLQRLCEEDGTTILVTSQYPSSLEYANSVGLMRNGHIYEEGTPRELLDRYDCSNYEEMFIGFCSQNTPRRIRPSIAPYLMRNTSQNNESQSNAPETSSQKSINEEINLPEMSTASVSRQRSHVQMLKEQNIRVLNCAELSHSLQEDRFQDDMFRKLNQVPMADWPIGERRRSAYMTPFVNVDLRRVFALLLKNLLIFRGNLFKISIFYFLFPALHVMLVCCIFGQTLHRLPIAVPGDVALGDAFGPTFVHSYLDSKIFSVHYTDGLEEAISSVKKGKSWAAIVPWTRTITNSSQSCLQTFPNNTSAQPFGLRLYLDQSNYIISQQIFYSFIGSMRRFLESQRSTTIVSSIWNGCLLYRDNLKETSKALVDWVEQKIADSRLNHSAFKIHQVIYGSTDFRFLSFILPGFLMSFIYTFSLVISAYMFLRETVSGLAERSLIAGTSGIELLLAHCLSMAILSVLQLCFLLIIMFWLFGLPSQGPFISLFTLILMQGVLGHLYGLFVAVICPKPKVALLCSSAFIIPGFFFSGIVWPIESMNPIAQRFANILPVTLPVNALRYILSRGRDMHFEPIASGFTVLLAHLGVVAFLTVAVFKFKTIT